MLFCTELTFDLILRLRSIFRLGIHPYVFYHTSRSTMSMDAIMYSILPSEDFFWAMDCWLIYGINLKKIFFLGTKRPMTVKLGMPHWVLEYYQVCSNDDPGLTLTYLTARSNLVPYAFVRDKGKTIDFLENFVVYYLKQQQMIEVTRSFCWLQNFVPWGLYAPYPRYMHVLNHEKKIIKSDFKEISLKLATNW